MSENWLELNQASKEYNLELNYLYDLVINSSIRSIPDNDSFLINVSDIDKISTPIIQTYFKQIIELKDQINSLKTEVAWLRSENMRNDQVIKDYHDKFSQLKDINDELMDLVNEQSETIRILNGHKLPKKKPIKINKSFDISVWMIIPILGLMLTALLEIIRFYQLYNLNNIAAFLGFH